MDRYFDYRKWLSSIALYSFLLSLNFIILHIVYMTRMKIISFTDFLSLSVLFFLMFVSLFVLLCFFSISFSFVSFYMLQYMNIYDRWILHHLYQKQFLKLAGGDKEKTLFTIAMLVAKVCAIALCMFLEIFYLLLIFGILKDAGTNT